MTFRLTKGGDVLGGDSFESFWLFVGFDIVQASGALQISQNNYFAFYSTQTSAFRSIMAPTFEGSDGDGRAADYQLEDTNTGRTLELKSLALEESRKAEFSNEYAQLHLFKFARTGDIGPDKWLNDGGWNDQWENRDRNDRPDYPFISHEVTFGDCSGRDSFWLMGRETNMGTQRLAFAVPFLKGSTMSTLLKNHTAETPELSIAIQGQEWKMFDQKPLPGTPRGFSMVCAGAFKEVSLGTDLEQWAGLVGANPTSSAVLDRLSSIVERRQSSASGDDFGVQGAGTGFERSLYTVDVTNQDSTVHNDTKPPIEVFYVNLRSAKHVPEMPFNS